MTEFVESFATQQLLPPWEAESAQTWGFVIRMSERRIADYLDAYFNGPYPDYAPFYYVPVPGAHYGLLSAVAFQKVASLNRRTASRLGDTGVAWDHLQHTEVYLVFPALRYPRSPDNLLTGEPTLVWVEPFIFSNNDSVVFSSREIWGSDMYLGSIVRAVGGTPHELHLDLGMIGIKKFNPRSMSELLSVLHIKTGGDSPVGIAEILKAKPELKPFAAILGGSGAFAAGRAPDGVDASPYAGGEELNNLKQFRDCYNMGAAIYRAIVASKTTHTDVDNIVLFDASKVEIAFMWSDSIGDLLTTLLDAKRPNELGPPADHFEDAERGPQSPEAPAYVGPPPDHFPTPILAPGEMDWKMDRLTVPAEFAFTYSSKARFEVVGTIHTYGQTPPV